MKKFKIIFIMLSAILMMLVFASCDNNCMHINIEASKIEGDCENSGKTVYTCADCNFSYEDDISAPKGHTFEKDIVLPDCTHGGYTVYTCSCGYSYTSDYTSALNHDFTIEETQATCTDAGKITYFCNRCDLTYSTISKDALGHTYIEEVISTLNCTEIGEIKYTCDGCGDSYSEITYPSGHQFSKSVIMPTLSDMGYTKYTCSVCDFSYDGDFTFYSSIVPNAYAGGSDVLATGIDVSCYNHECAPDGTYLPIDWNAISDEGIDYVILKAGSSLRDNGSLGGIDATFEMDYFDAKTAGLDVGVYFYTYAKTVDEIVNDAYLLLAILDGKQLEYPIYLDLEDESIRGLGAEALTEMCVEFFTVLQRSGYYTGLYVNHEWLYNVIKTDLALSKFDIWYARYPQAESPTWSVDEFGEPLGMWQYTDSGILVTLGDVPVDKNYSYKDYPSIIKDGGFNGYESDIIFPDDEKTFVWIKANALTVRSSEDFDSNDNIIAYVNYGNRLEVLEINASYTKILFNGKEAFISANPEYISWTPIIYKK